MAFRRRLHGLRTPSCSKLAHLSPTPCLRHRCNYVRRMCCMHVGCKVICCGHGVETSYWSCRSLCPDWVYFYIFVVHQGRADNKMWYETLSIQGSSSLLTYTQAFYYGMTPIAGAISGLIAYGVDRNLDGSLGRLSWEWFFIIEGVLTISWGILVLFLIPKLPETVAKRGSWLFCTEEEHAILLRRTVQGMTRASLNKMNSLLTVF